MVLVSNKVSEDIKKNIGKIDGIFSDKLKQRVDSTMRARIDTIMPNLRPLQKFLDKSRNHWFGWVESE